MKEKKNDYEFIREKLKILREDFFGLFKLNYSELYFDWIKKAPLSVFGVLANEDLRNFFLYDERIQKNIVDNISNDLLTHGSTINTERCDIDQVLFTEIEEKIPLFVEEYEKTGKVNGINLYQYNPNIYDVQLVFEEAFKDGFKNGCKEGDHVVIIASKPTRISGGRVLSGTIINKKNDVFDRLKVWFPRGLKVTYTPIDEIAKAIRTEKKAELKTNDSSKGLTRYLQAFSGKTDSYWKDIEPKNKKFMIIHIEPDNFVRNIGKQGEELSAEDVNGKFPILDGIDYKSNHETHVLYYMEV